MKNPFSHFSLKGRLLWMMLIPLFLSSSLSFFMNSRVEETMVNDILENTQDLATAIQISVEELTTWGATEKDRLQNYVHGLEHRGVKEVSILSSKNIVIESSNPKKIGRVFNPNGKKFVITEKRGDDSGSPEQKAYNIIIPVVVEDEIQGYVRIISVLDDFASSLRQNYNKRLLFTLLIFGATISISFYLVQKYMSPLHTVSEAARSVALGNFEPIPLSSGPREFRSLAQSFNEMVEKLKKGREREEEMHRMERFAALGRLSAGIAHEIKNPLNFISLSIDHLRTHLAPEDEEAKRQFHHQVLQIKDEIFRLSNLVQNFLQYDRPIELHRHPTLIEPLLGEVLSLARLQLEESNIQVVERLDPCLPPVRLDRDKIRTCLLNVVINAIQAMQEGGTLTISAEHKPDEGTIVVGVEDTGPGIDREELTRIFEPFYTTKNTGIGLGLSLTREILQKHGGTIELGNGKERGMWVRFLLPLDGRGSSDERSDSDFRPEARES